MSDIVARLSDRIGVVHSHYISDDMQLLIDAKAELDRATRLIRTLETRIIGLEAMLCDAQAKNDELEILVRWCVTHDGECLGDHPDILARMRRALSGEIK